MKIYIDLTYDITEDMPMWPGEASPEIRETRTVEKNGYSVQSIRFSNHMGTHLDAPSHFIQGGRTLDQIRLETFIGRAVILDFTDKQEGDTITRQDLQSHGDRFGPGSRILLKTGWDRKFRKDHFFEGFPCLDLEAARYLVTTRPALLGMDTPSPSPIGDPDEQIHKTLLGADVVHLEALRNLILIKEEECGLIVLPPPFKGFSGSPCRAVAVVDRRTEV